MTHWEYLAAIIALGAGLWPHVTAVGQWFRGLLIVVSWTDRETALPATSFLSRQGSHHAREAKYGSHIYFIRPLQRNHSLVFECMADSGGLFWYKRRPLWLKHDATDKIDSQFEYRFSFIRGTIDWEQFLLDVSDWNSMPGAETDMREVRHQVHYHHGKTLEMGETKKKNKELTYTITWGRANGLRPLRWRHEDIGGQVNKSSFDGLALTPELAALVEELKFFHASRHWYQDHHMTWRRGYIFHGDPGVGKTSLARATAVELDLPVHVFDLASMSNEDLREAWSEMAEDSPCMALIEDIDAVFEGRNNITTGGGMMASGGLTFDALLNCIDGVERADGVLLVMTTNHLESIDPALVNRPGRIDKVVHFQAIDFAGRLKIAKQILGEGPVAARFAQENPDVPAAQFVELCCREVLSRRYAERDIKPEKFNEPVRPLEKQVIS